MWMITKRYHNEPYSGPALKIIEHLLVKPDGSLKPLTFEDKDEAQAILNALDTRGHNFQLREFFPAPPKKVKDE